MAKLILIIQNAFLEYDTARVLAVQILSLTELAAHQSLTEVMSNWSERQLREELMTQKNVEIIGKDYKFIMVTDLWLGH
jgi:hypothetical protein